MSKINLNTWKEFKLKELGFSVFHGCRQKQADREEGEIPLLTAGKENQGVATYIGNPLCKYRDPITVDMFGNCFYHKGTYSGDDNIYFFINENLSDLVKIFITSIINKQNTALYNFKSQFRQPQADALTVILPSKSNNNPDWEYMESYMKNIMQKSQQNISKLNNIDTNKNKFDINDWKKFHLYDKGLFIIDMGTKLDKAKMTVSNPSVNFVGRANTNNGITASVDKISGLKPYQAGNMTLSLGGEYLGSCFIQPKEFYTSQNVIVLIPQWDMSNEVKKFISTMIFKESRTHYKAFVNELNRHIKTDFSFYLPVLSNGEPNWKYMENYMKRIMNNCVAKLDNLTLSV